MYNASARAMRKDMAYIYLCGLVIVFPVLVGGVIALAIHHSPLQKLGKHNRYGQLARCSLAGLLAFMSVFGLHAFLVANATVDLDICCCCMNSPDADEVKEHRSLLRREIWLRQVMPPFLSKTCYLNDPHLCELADSLDHMGSTNLLRIPGYIAGGVSVILLWKLSRRDPHLPLSCLHDDG